MQNFSVRLVEGADYVDPPGEHPHFTNEIDFLDGLHFAMEDGGFIVEEPEEETEFTPSLAGDDLVYYRKKNRKIRIIFTVYGFRSSSAHGEVNHIFDNLRDLERMLNRARLRNVMVSVKPKTYVEWKVATNSSYNYFEVVSAKLTMPADLMGIEQVLQTDRRGYPYLKGVELEVICKPYTRLEPDDVLGAAFSWLGLKAVDMPYWQGGAPPEYQNAVNVQNGQEDLSIYPGEFADNWAKLDTVEVVGDVPQAAKITLTNVAAKNIRRVYIGSGDIELSGVTQHTDRFFQAENGAFLNGTSHTTTADAEAAYGEYELTTIVPNSGTLQDIWKANQKMPVVGGFRVFAIFREAVSEHIVFQASMRAIDYLGVEPGVSLVGPLTFCDGTTGVIDLGYFSLPINMGITTEAIMVSGFYLAAYSKSGSVNVKFDYIVFLPVDMGYRVLDIAPAQTVLDYHIVDDPYLNVQYTDDDGYEDRLGNVIGHFSPIMVYPGEVQYLCFMFVNDDNVVEPNTYMKLEVDYIPTSSLVVW